MSVTTEDKLSAALRRNKRLEQKAASANRELERIRQENAKLKLENKIQLGWLNAEDSYTRRYKALESRFNIIRDVVSDNFPQKYGQPGAYNWFGERP
jgi:predicted  nucleic acid-binding Zn-ribbon protein